MIREPFTLLHPFRDQLTVGFWSRVDDATCEEAGAMMKTENIAELDQVHGGDAVTIGGPTRNEIKADAIITKERGLLLLTKAADCQSFVFFDPERNLLAVCHAGWKGLLAHAVTHTIDLLKEQGSHPEDLLVCAAPSLGFCCAEFTDPEKELPGIDPKFFDGRHADLQAIADDELERNGITANRRERMTLCTKCNRDLLWSYRADKEAVQNGHRNLLGAMLKKQ